VQIRKDFRYHDMKGWAERVARGMPGVVATGSLGDYRLSVWQENDTLKYHNFYFRDQDK